MDWATFWMIFPQTHLVALQVIEHCCIKRDILKNVQPNYGLKILIYKCFFTCLTELGRCYKIKGPGYEYPCNRHSIHTSSIIISDWGEMHENNVEVYSLCIYMHTLVCTYTASTNLLHFSFFTSVLYLKIFLTFISLEYTQQLCKLRCNKQHCHVWTRQSLTPWRDSNPQSPVSVTETMTTTPRRQGTSIFYVLVQISMIIMHLSRK
jgi:hypothetical protein